MMSSTTRSTFSRREARERLLAVARRDDAVAVALERVREQLLHGVLVVDEEDRLRIRPWRDARAGTAHPRAYYSPGYGRSLRDSRAAGGRGAARSSGPSTAACTGAPGSSSACRCSSPRSASTRPEPLARAAAARRRSTPSRRGSSPRICVDRDRRAEPRRARPRQLDRREVPRSTASGRSASASRRTCPGLGRRTLTNVVVRAPGRSPRIDRRPRAPGRDRLRRRRERQRVRHRRARRARPRVRAADDVGRADRAPSGPRTRSCSSPPTAARTARSAPPTWPQDPAYRDRLAAVDLARRDRGATTGRGSRIAGDRPLTASPVLVRTAAERILEETGEPPDARQRLPAAPLARVPVLALSSRRRSSPRGVAARDADDGRRATRRDPALDTTSALNERAPGPARQRRAAAPASRSTRASSPARRRPATSTSGTGSCAAGRSSSCSRR